MEIPKQVLPTCSLALLSLARLGGIAHDVVKRLSHKIVALVKDPWLTGQVPVSCVRVLEAWA